MNTKNQRLILKIQMALYLFLNLMTVYIRVYIAITEYIDHAIEGILDNTPYIADVNLRWNILPCLQACFLLTLPIQKYLHTASDYEDGKT